MPYPTVPSRRMAWDEDGSVGMYYRNAGDGGATGLVPLEMSANARLSGNQENPINPFNFPDIATRSGWVGVIFPEVREIDGIYAYRQGISLGQVQVSGDTTNLWSGTFTVAHDYANGTGGDGNFGGYRTSIVSLAESNKRAIRVWTTNGTSANWDFLHIYGTILPGVTPDRLLFIDETTGLEFGLPIDYGDIPRGSAEDREFRLKNNSGSLTASTVQITGEALYRDSGSWYSFAEGDPPGTYQSTLPLTSAIAPAASSPLLTIRRVTPSDEDLGPHAGRIQANVGTWA